ncbi:MAG: flagellar assembly protein FliH [Thiotrichaceae bacterium]|nr:flagellar assembly protein FliH [Thiotrichaceae bacterium]PCI15119.1 MAG: flagellar assembly protein FliH [Thiotrichales bacterium]
MSNRIILSEDSADCSRWQIPEVGGAASSVRKVVKKPTDKEIEVRRQKGYEEGFAKGKQEGVVAGQTNLTKQAQNLAKIAGQLSKPLAELDDDVVDELVSLAMTIAKHMVRREIKTNPGEIVAVVREAAALLPTTSRTIKIFLHPEDSALLKESLSISEQGIWQLVDDPALTRGGCRLVTESAQLDASIETRLAAVVAELMGGEREGDDSHAST